MIQSLRELTALSSISSTYIATHLSPCVCRMYLKKKKESSCDFAFKAKHFIGQLVDLLLSFKKIIVKYTEPTDRRVCVCVMYFQKKGPAIWSTHCIHQKVWEQLAQEERVLVYPTSWWRGKGEGRHTPAFFCLSTHTQWHHDEEVSRESAQFQGIQYPLPASWVPGTYVVHRPTHRHKSVYKIRK